MRGEPFQLISIDKNGEPDPGVLLYRGGNSGYAENPIMLKSLRSRTFEFADKLFEDVGKFDIPMRELEYANSAI